MGHKIILASASPRRRELLEMLGLAFEILPARGEERIEPALAKTPDKLVKALARQKAAEAASARGDAEAVVIGADTVVVLDGTVLGKPKDAGDAKRMLRALSGRRHDVYTGVTVIRDNTVLSRAERTGVYFRKLGGDEIERYVATGEPLDKAGAYGIQGFGSLFAERIEGDFFNVMGLPLCLLGSMLKEVGVELL